MVNADMRSYNYFTYGEENEYGQAVLSPEPIGTIKIAINTITQSIQDSIKYKEATYIGLTHDANVNDTYVIEYEGERLKVLYVNGRGRLKQVFMAEI